MILLLSVVKLIKENRKVPQKELVTMIMEKFGVDRIKAMTSYRYAKKVYWLKVDSISSIKEEIIYPMNKQYCIDPSFDMKDQPVYLDNYSPTYFQKTRKFENVY